MKSGPQTVYLLKLVARTLGGLVIALFLFLGSATLLSQDIPESKSLENTAVVVVLLSTAFNIVYAFYHPLKGGVLLCILTIPCAIVFNAFYLSHLVLTAREVGYHSFWSVITAMVLVLGIVFIIISQLETDKHT
ncbi:hypothetical protein [Aliikangiella sp. G2MR2-5]|uniref:hypothetical protein n=1 Tax=Aliikangiella sp. G2MR2-5 TaxID=2788943 RepID=UPI0018AB6EFC|nr:hypothetical protein [Aliikangiella sp. G2MR2-5]